MEIGTTQQENPVRTYLFALAAFITAAGLATCGAVQRLEQATAQQCQTRDWPAHQHAAHMDFCESAGYPTY